MADAQTEIDLARAEHAMREFLAAVGLDLTAQGMKDTPARAAELYAELFSGLRSDPQKLWTNTMTEETDGLVAVRTIPFHSVCEHHLLPFFGTAHIVYRPHAGRVAGFGIFTQLVDLMARRPQLQERLTVQIANALEEALKPKGVLVMIEAEHMCMTMRGIKKPGSKTVTRVARGICQSDKETRQEIIAMIHHN